MSFLGGGGQCWRCGQWVGSHQVHEIGMGCNPPSGPFRPFPAPWDDPRPYGPLTPPLPVLPTAPPAQPTAHRCPLCLGTGYVDGHCHPVARDKADGLPKCHGCDGKGVVWP
jgi:hypothetical protein